MVWSLPGGHAPHYSGDGTQASPPQTRRAGPRSELEELYLYADAPEYEDLEVPRLSLLLAVPLPQDSLEDLAAKGSLGKFLHKNN
jgi:hypothetical protein